MTIRSAYIALSLVAFSIIAACAGHHKLTLAEQQQADMEALAQATLVTVEEPQRADQAVALLEKLDKIMAAAVEDEQVFRTRFSELNRDYNADRVEFEELFEQYNVFIELHQKRALAVRAKMIGLLSIEEWAALEKTRKQAVQSALQTL